MRSHKLAMVIIVSACLLAITPIIIAVRTWGILHPDARPANLPTEPILEVQTESFTCLAAILPSGSSALPGTRTVDAGTIRSAAAEAALNLQPSERSDAAIPTVTPDRHPGHPCRRHTPFGAQVGEAPSPPSATQIHHNRHLDDRLNARKLMEGKIDLWAGGELQVPFKARQSGYRADAIEPVLTFAETEIYLAFNRDTDPELVARWQAAYETMVADGIYAEICQRYGLAAEP